MARMTGMTVMTGTAGVTRVTEMSGMTEMQYYLDEVGHNYANGEHFC